MVHRSLEVARTLADEGIDVEVVDLRTLAPLDTDTLLTSVRKTGRLVVAHEAWKVGGIGAEVAAVVAEGAFDALKAPIARVGAPSIPIPSATALRNMTIPSAEKIADAVRSVVRGSPVGAR
jgi:pyruvate/2-oxoglutarate/acetoin dehydrogenase E1 component